MESREIIMSESSKTADRAEPVQLDEIFLARDRDVSDIIERIRFDATTGGIWFNNQPAVLFRSETFQLFRRAIYDAVGDDEARKLISAFGFAAGSEDGELAMELRGKMDTVDVLAAGPAILSLQGFGTVGPGGMQAEVDAEHFFMDINWGQSIEAEFQVRDYGIASKTACCYNSGYGSGFLSRVMSRPIICQEVECQAMGHARCRFIAGYRESFDELAPELDILHDTASWRHHRPRVAEPKPPPVARIKPKSKPGTRSSNELIGESVGFLTAMHMVRQVAETDATVLFLGESGVGKERFSKTLHGLSRRNQQPFVAVNCAAIPELLLESELFGVEKGAYTGASASRAGRFEWADGGTLFLDEVGTLSLPAQGKLLRVLQEGELERLGAKKTIRVDVRIVAATNVDLREQVALGNFRDDLFYRLNVFPIRLPPLRGRRDDIPLLMDEFLAKFSHRHGKSPDGFTEEAKAALITYDWPGNIREFENIIERAVILVDDGSPIQVNHLFTSGEQLSSHMYKPDQSGHLVTRTHNEFNWHEVGARALDTSAPMETLERSLIEAALERTRGNVSAAARLLNMSRGQLTHRMKRLG